MHQPQQIIINIPPANSVPQESLTEQGGSTRFWLVNGAIIALFGSILIASSGHEKIMNKAEGWLAHIKPYLESPQKPLAEAPKHKRKLAYYVENVGKQHGLPKTYMAITASIESSLNPKAQRGGAFSQSARGLFQFIGKTGKRYGLIKNGKDRRLNAELSTQKAAELAVDNSKKLRKAGIPITPENLYLAHNQGAHGAIAVLQIHYGKKAQGSHQLYKNILNNCGKYKKRIRQIGKANKATIDMFLKHRKSVWNKHQKHIKTMGIS